MIVVAIIGILAAVAIPAYRDYIATANGGAAMKGQANFSTKVQGCILTGRTKVKAMPLMTLLSFGSLIKCYWTPSRAGHPTCISNPMRKLIEFVSAPTASCKK